MLTAAQNTLLKDDIEANTDQVVIDALAAGANDVIADSYNQQADPDFYVFQKLITPAEMGAVIELDDVAGMAPGDVDKLSAFFLLRPGGFNGEDATDRTGFDNVLSTGPADDSQQAVAAIWQRLSTEAEELFAIGTGTLVAPAIAGFVGSLSFQDVIGALNS